MDRESGLVRLRVGYQTDGVTLCEHVHKWTHPTAIVHTDGWRGYNRIDRSHVIVHHADDEWARDDDGILETHVNTIEGVWTTVRNFLRPFRGVYNTYGYRNFGICHSLCGDCFKSVVGANNENNYTRSFDTPLISYFQPDTS